ncbi:MAG: efflux transporter outer membrane subunit [Halieaceae bacterium]|nr:efflux transporter outer membrane subunit [Halieaceae bacterium]
MSRTLLRRLKPVSLLSAGVLLSACTTLGPEYLEPTPEWLAAWQPGLYGQYDAAGSSAAAAARDANAAGPLSDWWRRFEDPQLEALVSEALRASPTLQLAGLRIVEAGARLRGAEALRLPQQQTLQSTAAYLRQRRSDGLLPASDNSFGSYDATLAAGWELDFWGRFRRGIEAADAAWLASVAAQRDAQVLLIARTAELYFAWCSTQLRIAIARENADIQKRSFEITTRLFERGQESELDLQQARTQYLATLATIPDLERQLTQQRNALALLLGRPPGPLAELGRAASALPVFDPVSIRELPAQLLLRRPDVRAAAWQAAAQSAQIGIASAELYPAISLFGSFGWAGDSLGITRDGTTFAAGPALRWNIFDYGRIRANIRVQDARLQQALLAFDVSVLDAAREIDDAAVAVVKTAEASAVLAQSRAAAQRSLELANRRYQEGYADFQRVLDAQRALFTQAERELQAQSAHIFAVIALYKALGGGWQSMPLEAMIPAEVRQQMRERTNWGELLQGSPPANLEDADSMGSRNEER